MLHTFIIIVLGSKSEYKKGVWPVLLHEFFFAEPVISADSKGHGISAKALWVAALMLARPLNSSFCVKSYETNIKNHVD
jgi:hypothetical protein